MDVQPLFPPSNLITNTNMKEFIGGLNEGNRTVFDNASIIGYGSHPPISGMTNPQPPIFPNNSNISDSMPVPDDVVTGLNSCNLLLSRKRSIDLASFPPPAIQFTSSSPPNNNNNNNPITSAPSSSSSFSFLGDDISLQIQQQQLEIDQLVAMHAEQMKLYIQERRNRAMRGIVEAVEQEIVTKLRERDEEIAKIGQINWALQEKVKTMSNENQLWKDLAHRNQMTANALKNNLDQMLHQVQVRNQQANHHQALMEFNATLSFCSSNSINYEGRGFNDDECDQQQRLEAARGGGGGDRLCRRCGTEESSVLLLPCRHLCVCSGCGSSVQTCPICQSNKTASVNINLSF